MSNDSPSSTFIGGGQFGRVYATQDRPILAFKVVRRAERTADLVAEHAAISTVYAYTVASTALFTIPRPLGLYVPTAGKCCVSPPFEELCPTHATYVMDRIPSLPSILSDALLGRFAPKNSQPITMCRLYFGKESAAIGKDSARCRFFNSRNCPIDFATYDWLRTAVAPFAALPDPQHVAAGMGHMMARVHNAGYDCRDMEFTLAGGYSTSQDTGLTTWGLHAFDFDQMNRLPDSLDEQVELMCQSFVINDPYFPRPRPGDAMYESFKRGYAGESNESTRTTAFFEALERI
ncbi:MAG: hypothetical protein M1828_006203 [Chrysothrix sp. TS-e1954]|nr:MAG: hypothetical protein M1828_006203 [Chrysothrix sp. TS-e1954]